MQLSKMSTPRLYEELKKWDELTREAIVKQSQIFIELDSRGEKIGNRTKGIFKYYREIASGKLSPETVLSCAGSQFLLDGLKTLSVTEQNALTSGEKIRVADYNDMGKVVPFEKPLLSLTKREAELVFCDKGIRPFAQQKKTLEAQRKTDVRTGSSTNNIRYDFEKEEIVIGRERCTVTQLSSVLVKAGFEPIRRVAKKVA